MILAEQHLRRGGEGSPLCFSQHNTPISHQQERWPTTQNILLSNKVSDTSHRTMSMCYRMSFILAVPPDNVRRELA